MSNKQYVIELHEDPETQSYKIGRQAVDLTTIESLGLLVYALFAEINHIAATHHIITEPD